jgi:DNA polymerase-4
MSIILHVDFNSFFASVEQQANPFLRNKPIAITGKQGAENMSRSIIATASKQAKKLGVQTAMSVFEAKQICPELILLVGDMRKYSEITSRMLSILQNNSDAVEQFSTDEAFADITKSAEDYFGATIIAQIIRDQISQACGKYCTVSIGIGPNKAIAKLASGSVKPNGLTVIQSHEVINFLNNKQLSNICGIGEATIKHLEQIGICSFETLRKASRELLMQKFGTVKGEWLYNIARGIDCDKVNNAARDPKSISHSYTFQHDLEFDAEIKTNLLSIADAVSLRLRNNKFKTSHISLFMRYKDFNEKSSNMTLANPIDDGLSLYKCALQLLEKSRDYNKPIRLMGISASQLSINNNAMPLFIKDQKIQRAQTARDHILRKFGTKALCRAATINTVFHERASGWHYDHQL